jgi:hypothetical protein
MTDISVPKPVAQELFQALEAGLTDENVSEVDNSGPKQLTRCAETAILSDISGGKAALQHTAELLEKMSREYAKKAAESEFEVVAAHFASSAMEFSRVSRFLRELYNGIEKYAIPDILH